MPTSVYAAESQDLCEAHVHGSLEGVKLSGVQRFTVVPVASALAGRRPALLDHGIGTT
jgi:hypothetical protein